MSDNTNRLAGIANMTIDGQVFAVAGTAKWSPSGVTRETLKGQDGIHGYKEMPTEGKMSATLRDSGGLSVAGLNAVTNSTIVFGLANGKTVIGRNMWWAGDPAEVDTQEGTLEVRFEGPSVTESN